MLIWISCPIRYVNEWTKTQLLSIRYHLPRKWEFGGGGSFWFSLFLLQSVCWVLPAENILVLCPDVWEQPLSLQPSICLPSMPTKKPLHLLHLFSRNTCNRDDLLLYKAFICKTLSLLCTLISQSYHPGAYFTKTLKDKNSVPLHYFPDVKGSMKSQQNFFILLIKNKRKTIFIFPFSSCEEDTINTPTHKPWKADLWLSQDNDVIYTSCPQKRYTLETTIYNFWNQGPLIVRRPLFLVSAATHCTSKWNRHFSTLTELSNRIRSWRTLLHSCMLLPSWLACQLPSTTLISPAGPPLLCQFSIV